MTSRSRRRDTDRVGKQARGSNGHLAHYGDEVTVWGASWCKPACCLAGPPPSPAASAFGWGSINTDAEAKPSLTTAWATGESSLANQRKSRRQARESKPWRAGPCNGRGRVEE